MRKTEVYIIFIHRQNESNRLFLHLLVVIVCQNLAEKNLIFSVIVESSPILSVDQFRYSVALFQVQFSFDCVSSVLNC